MGTEQPRWFLPPPGTASLQGVMTKNIPDTAQRSLGTKLLKMVPDSMAKKENSYLNPA